MKKKTGRSKRLSTRQRNKLFKDIEENPNDSYYSIAQRNKVTVGYVSNLARQKFGRLKRSEMWGGTKKWTPQVVDVYLESKGSTIRRITESYEDCKSQIKWRCTLCNNEWMMSIDSIKRRVEAGYSLQGCPNCGYDSTTLYHDFLDSLNSESAYFLGVFYARGSIRKSKSLQLQTLVLTSPSKEKLEKIQSLLASNCEVKSGSDKDSFYVLIKSPKLISKLKEYKAVNSKGGKTKIIPQIIRDNREFFADFLRGYMDCAGYVEIINSPSSTYETARVNIPASKSFAQEIQQWHKRSLKKKKTMGYVTCGKKANQTSRASEYHLTGTYAVHGFLKLVYNSSVSPIKYMSKANYDKFLYLQHKLIKRAQRDEKIVELAQEYTEKISKYKKGIPSRLAKKHNVSHSLITQVADGYNGKKLKPVVCEEIREEIKKANKRKEEAEMLVEKAVTLTGINATRFIALSRNDAWKNISRYTDKIEEFKLEDE